MGEWGGGSLHSDRQTDGKIFVLCNIGGLDELLNRIVMPIFLQNIPSESICPCRKWAEILTHAEWQKKISAPDKASCSSAESWLAFLLVKVVRCPPRKNTRLLCAFCKHLSGQRGRNNNLSPPNSIWWTVYGLIRHAFCLSRCCRVSSVLRSCAEPASSRYRRRRIAARQENNRVLWDAPEGKGTALVT